MEGKIRNLAITALFMVVISNSLGKPTEDTKYTFEPRFKSLTTDTVYFTKYTNKYQSLNLGMGFPNYNPPEFLKEALRNVSFNTNALIHQYSGAEGQPRLVNAIAKLYSKIINRKLDPLENIIVTAGGSEGLHNIFEAVTLPGDEWIVFEPFYEVYQSMLTIAGAEIKYIQLQPVKSEDGLVYTDWTFDKKKLESLFNNKTKAILLNNPHNPTGKVFTLEELEFIADLAKKWNILVVSDEVYEFLLYDDRKHYRIGTFPGMFERTLTLGSASKTYSVTGWRIGWMYGPAEIISHVKIMHFNTMLCDSTPLQEAFAVALERAYEDYDKPDSFINTNRKEVQYKRDQLVGSLIKVGMTPSIPQSGFFILSDWTDLENQIDTDQEIENFRDFRFAKWMIRVVGLGGIPGSAYYSKENKRVGGKFIRYCFAKDNDTLSKVERILTNRL